MNTCDSGFVVCILQTWLGILCGVVTVFGFIFFRHIFLLPFGMFGGGKKVVGYKVLLPKGGQLYSPQRGSKWYDGQLIADEEPTVNNRNGIYLTYDKNDPEIQRYLDMYPGSVVVEVEADTQHGVVQHERGMRVGKGRIK